MFSSFINKLDVLYNFNLSQINNNFFIIKKIEVIITNLIIYIIYLLYIY